MERYNTYSDHLKKKYGEKVYKIPISLPVTCPNRDGSLSSEPCIFCGSIGADYETKADRSSDYAPARQEHCPCGAQVQGEEVHRLFPELHEYVCAAGRFPLLGGRGDGAS